MARVRMRNPTSRTERMKAGGVCPWDGLKCSLARSCTLARMDACLRAVSGLSDKCRVCRERNGGRCVFECFRRDTGLARLRVASMEVRG